MMRISQKQWKNIPGRGNCQCKGPEACDIVLDQKKPSVAGVESRWGEECPGRLERGPRCQNVSEEQLGTQVILQICSLSLEQWEKHGDF